MSNRVGKKSLMRTFLVLICSIAIASVASGAQEKKKEQASTEKAGANDTGCQAEKRWA
jgi:hypothetical protein